MRKWLAIGLLVLVIGGGIAALVLRSRGNSVEYHVRAYREAEQGLTVDDTFLDHVRDVWRKLRAQRMGRKARVGCVGVHRRLRLALCADVAAFRESAGGRVAE